MRKIVFIACLFLTFSVFSQHEDKTESINLPTSIFLNYSFDNFKFKDEVIVNSLNLTGYKFMVVDSRNTSFLYNNLQFDIRNLKRDISFDDINDDYRKAELNINDVRNGNHFIWRMWDTSLQKEFQQNKNN